MKFITVTGYKGGVAKSTTSIHVATYFSDLGPTLLVDGDPNRTALAWAERGKMPFKVADERQAMSLVKDYDFIVIDTPARPDSNDLQELAKGCNLMILPTTPDVVSLEPMLKTANDLKGATYRILLTIVPPAPSKEGVTIRQDLEEHGIPSFKSMIRRSAGFQKAALLGVPVRNISDKSKVAWRDYQALGKEIMEVLTNG